MLKLSSSESVSFMFLNLRQEKFSMFIILRLFSGWLLSKYVEEGATSGQKDADEVLTLGPRPPPEQ